MPIHLEQFNNQINIEIPQAQQLLLVNVGEPNIRYRVDHDNKVSYHNNRKWEDSLTFGFISGGQKDPHYPVKTYLRNRWINQIKKVKEGDIVCAYVTELGFVGVGKCISAATPIMERKLFDGSFLRDQSKKLANPLLFLTKVEVNGLGFTNHIPNTYGCEDEYAILVEWKRTYTRREIAQTRQYGLGQLGVTPHVVSKLMTKTREPMVQFVQTLFNVVFQNIVY